MKTSIKACLRIFRGKVYVILMQPKEHLNSGTLDNQDPEDQLEEDQREEDQEEDREEKKRTGVIDSSSKKFLCTV